MNYGKPSTTACLHCGATVQQKPGPGRVRRYCGPWHAELYRRHATLITADGERLAAYPIAA